MKTLTLFSNWIENENFNVHLGNTSEIRKLVEEGANVNIKYEDGETPLSLAVLSDKNEIVKIILDKGADINATFDGFTPLERAASRGRLFVGKYLFQMFWEKIVRLPI